MNFLCIDPKVYTKGLLVKKIDKLIREFNSSEYFQSVGMKKKVAEKMPNEDEEIIDDYEDDNIEDGMQEDVEVINQYSESAIDEDL